MNDFKDWVLLLLTGLGLDILAMKSGMIGGFFSLTYEKKRSARQAVISIASGAILAGYLGPLAAQVFNFDGQAYGGICFLIGLLSMRLVPWIFQSVEGYLKEFPKIVLKKKNGKNDGDAH